MDCLIGILELCAVLSFWGCNISINKYIYIFWCSKIEGSKATAKQTAELLRSVISQQRMPHVNQAGALIDAIKMVGEQLIAANPVGMLPISFFCFHFLQLLMSYFRIHCY